VQSEHAESHWVQSWVSAFPKCPAGQVLAQVVEKGCKKYPELQIRHSVFASPVQIEHDGLQAAQVLVDKTP